MNKIIYTSLSALLLITASASSFAAGKKPLSYNYAEFGVNASKDVKKSKTDSAMGGQFNLSFELGPNAFIMLGAEGEESKKHKIKSTKTEEFGRDFVGHIGFGGYAPLLKNLDLVGEFVYLRSEFQNIEDVKSGKKTTTKKRDNGWGTGLGVRSVFANWFELNSFVRYADIMSEDFTTITVGARAHMSLFSIGLDVSEQFQRSKRHKHHVDLTARFRF